MADFNKRRIEDLEAEAKEQGGVLGFTEAPDEDGMVPVYVSFEADQDKAGIVMHIDDRAYFFRLGEFLRVATMATRRD